MSCEQVLLNPLQQVRRHPGEPMPDRLERAEQSATLKLTQQVHGAVEVRTDGHLPPHRTGKNDDIRASPGSRFFPLNLGASRGLLKAFFRNPIVKRFCLPLIIWNGNLVNPSSTTELGANHIAFVISKLFADHSHFVQVRESGLHCLSVARNGGLLKEIGNTMAGSGRSLSSWPTGSRRPQSQRLQRRSPGLDRLLRLKASSAAPAVSARIC